MQIKKSVLVLAVLVLLGIANSAMATTVVTFDDLSVGSAVPSNYQGLNWSVNWYVDDLADYNSGYGNTYGPLPSMSNFAYNGYGVTSVSISDGLFAFEGAYFSTWASYNSFASFSSPSVELQGYNGATLVGTETLNLPSNSFVWLPWTFGPISQLDILNDGTDGHWWLMDNFTYSAVPEPISMIFFGTGLAAVGGFVARRKTVRGT